MHWLFLLLALGAMAVAFRTTSMALVVLSLLAALGLFVAWAMAWYAARVGKGRSQALIDPVELHRLRQIAEARKSANPAGGDTSPPAG